MPMQMAAAGDERESKRVCATTAVRQCWSSMFPDDLLAVVYRMVASPRGRARFAAVCRPWRAAARAAPPAAALPWLLLSPGDTGMKKQLHCPEDGAVMRIPLPGWMKLHGCHDGGWVATCMLASLRIVNIFSGAEVKLNCGNIYHHFADQIIKAVFSESPTSGDCILAIITNNVYMVSCIRLCRVGCKSNEWTMQKYHGMPFVDIMFCNSKLYGLRRNGNELVEFEIDMNEDGAPVVIAQRRLATENIAGTIPVTFSRESVSYIFDLHGKLAMARRAHWSADHEPFFKVFELVDIDANQLTTCYKNKWMEVTNLGDHALFLGRTFSKLVKAPANRSRGVERNHIYFAHQHCFSHNDVVPEHAVLLAISNERRDKTYSMEDDWKNHITGNEVPRIRSVGYFTKGVSHQGCAWVLPPAI